jgi:hypothetical protein
VPLAPFPIVIPMMPLSVAAAGRASHALKSPALSLCVDAGVLEPIVVTGKLAVIPPRPNRLEPGNFDREFYRNRSLIENSLCKLPGDSHPL